MNLYITVTHHHDNHRQSLNLNNAVTKTRFTFYFLVVHSLLCNKIYTDILLYNIKYPAVYRFIIYEGSGIYKCINFYYLNVPSHSHACAHSHSNKLRMLFVPLPIVFIFVSALSECKVCSSLC